MPADTLTCHVFRDRDGLHAVASIEDHNAAQLPLQAVEITAAQRELDAWLTDACWLPEDDWAPDGDHGYSRRFTPGPNAIPLFKWDA